ncbi:MAG: hypothetical protein GY737_26025 [Desulfobacteraceae bacterium]|nr:hypothetical protein [Desulfobacteraceae bacterium]
MQFIIGVLLAISGVSAYGVYCRRKDHVILDIRNVLEDCRSLKSWDDRSELKLGTWVEGDERELHRKSLRVLKRILKEMIRYYQIHLEMADGEPYGTYQSQPK